MNGRPIRARRIGKVARGWRWAKRNPLVATLAATVVLRVIVGIVATSYWAKIASDKSQQAIESLVNALASAHPSQVQTAIEAIMPFREDAWPLLRRDFAATDGIRRLHIAYGLAGCGQIERQFLISAIADAPQGECDNLAVALAQDRESALEDLKTQAVTATSRVDWRLKTRLATVALHLNDPSIAAEMLQAEPPAAAERQPAVKPTPDWHDPPLDPSWTTVDEATKATLMAAHGMLEERFAFCLDMPWETYLSTIEVLRPSGYRPTRVRPFVHGNQRLVAAVWMRDSVRWHLETSLTAENMPPSDANAERDGLVPSDVAAYLGDRETVLYSLLWSQVAAESERRRVCVGLTNVQYEATTETLRQKGFPAPLSLQACVSADGVRRYAGIWTNQVAETVASPMAEAPGGASGVQYGWPWEDISFAGAGRVPHPLEALRQRLAAMKQLPSAQQDTTEVRLSRAVAHYYLDQPKEALVDLDHLAAEPSVSPYVLLYRALCLAQLGHAEETKEYISKLLLTPAFELYAAGALILTDAWLGKVEEAKRGLDNLLEGIKEDPETLLGTQQQMDVRSGYGGARLAAQLARILFNRDPTDLAAWKHRSLVLLRHREISWLDGRREISAVENGPGVVFEIENDPAFAPLFDEPDFQSLVAQSVAARSYAGVWREGSQFKSSVEAGRALEEQQQVAKNRNTENFRPVAVAVGALPEQPDLRSTIVWNRPLAPPPPLSVWDPIQRTMFIDYFPTWSGSPEKLAEGLRGVENASLRSGMCLAIGSVSEPSADATKTLRELLADWFANARDGGTHGAAGWALRSWGLPIPEIRNEPNGRDGCDWYITKTGLTMIRVPTGEIQLSDNDDRTRRRKADLHCA